MHLCEIQLIAALHSAQICIINSKLNILLAIIATINVDKIAIIITHIAFYIVIKIGQIQIKETAAIQIPINRNFIGIDLLVVFNLFSQIYNTIIQGQIRNIAVVSQIPGCAISKGQVSLRIIGPTTISMYCTQEVRLFRIKACGSRASSLKRYLINFISINISNDVTNHLGSACRLNVNSATVSIHGILIRFNIIINCRSGYKAIAGVQGSFYFAFNIVSAIGSKNLNFFFATSVGTILCTINRIIAFSSS